MTPQPLHRGTGDASRGGAADRRGRDATWSRGPRRLRRSASGARRLQLRQERSSARARLPDARRRLTSRRPSTSCAAWPRRPTCRSSTSLRSTAARSSPVPPRVAGVLGAASAVGTLHLVRLRGRRTRRLRPQRRLVSGGDRGRSCRAPHRPDGSGAYISVGAAYNLPITGVTAAGFSSAANTVYYRDERVGVPNNLLLTVVLQQPDLERARDLIAGAPRARGSNHLLADAAGRIWDIETTGGRWALVDGSPRRELASAGVTALFRAHQRLRVEGAGAGRRLPLGGRTPCGATARRELACRGPRGGGPGRAGQGRAVRPRERVAQHLRPLGRRRPRPGPERDDRQHGLGAGADGAPIIARGQPCSSGYLTFEL